VLSPKSHLPIPKFPPSGYLSSPLASVLSLARDCGLVLNTSSEFSDSVVDDGDGCAVCLERPCNVAAEGLSVHCAPEPDEKNQLLQMLILFVLDV
jgi:E3 ubiquitin-protein ligase XBAT32/33